MHVLFVCSWYPGPDDPTLGIFIRRHALAASRYVKVSVVYFSKGTENRYLLSDDEGLSVVQITTNGPASWRDWPGVFLRRNRLFRDAVQALTARRGKINLIQLNVVFPAFMWSYLFMSRWRGPMVIAEHWSGYLPSDGRYKGWIQRFFTFSAFRRSSLVLCVSKAQEAAMRNHDLQGNFDYLPNVADIKVFRRLDHIYRNPEVWIHISNLDPLEKNTDFLLHLFHYFLKQGKVKRLLVCGGTVDKVSAFLAQADKLGIKENIEATGNVSPEVLNEKLNQAHLFLLSSHFEGQPCVVLEAMLTGVRIVAPAVGDIPNMLAQGRGHCFTAGDQTAAIKAVEAALGEASDGVGIPYAKTHHSVQAVGAYLFEKYKKLTGGHLG